MFVTKMSPISRLIAGGNCPKVKLWWMSPPPWRGKYCSLRTFTPLGNLMKLHMMSWPVQSLCYVTPGPLVRPRQWPLGPYGQQRPIHSLRGAVCDFKAQRLLLFTAVRFWWLPDDTCSKRHHFKSEQRSWYKVNMQARWKKLIPW